MLKVSTITTPEELRKLGPEWLDLNERTTTRVPFLLPEWHLTWWESFRQDRRLLRDSLRVKVVRDAARRLVGVVPFMLTERPRFGPIRVRTLNMLGADEYITEHRAPIVDPTSEAEVGRALAANLGGDKGWDWIAWEGLERSSPFAVAIEGAMGSDWRGTESGNLLALSPTWEQFRAGLKRNIKESLRHGYNSLKRDGLEATLAVSERADEIDEALGTFFRLHAMRAADTRAPHPDRFARAGAKRFLRTVCARLAQRGVARVFTLRVRDTPVAARVGFVVGDCLYLYYSGYEPAWGKYGIMTTTVAEAIKYAIGQRLAMVHLSMGIDVSKSRWSPNTPTFHRSVCVRPRWTSRAAVHLHQWARQSDWVKGLGGVLPKRQFAA